MANSINVAGLSSYIDQLSQKMLREAVLGGNTLNRMNILTGVKYKSAIKPNTSTLTIQDGGVCGTLTPSGTVLMAEKDIEVCPLRVEEFICLPDFNSKYIGQYMKNNKGSYQDELNNEFYEFYVSDKVAKIQAVIADLIWAGNKDTGSGNLAKCDGLIKHIDEASGVISPVTSPSSPALLTVSNAVDQIRKIIGYTPKDIKGENDLTIFMSHANFDTLVWALQDKNMFFYDTTGDMGNSFRFPGTRWTIAADRGLDLVEDGKRIIATPASNLNFATDLENDFESFKLWYDMDTNQVKFRSEWKQGVQISYPQYVVNYVGDVI